MAFAFWGFTFYIGLALSSFHVLPDPLSIVLALPVAILILLALRFAYRGMIAPAIARLIPPEETARPPIEFQNAAGAAEYLRPPKMGYPVLAHARGQCGWVALKFRRATDGRIVSYQVVDQTPRRLFESTVASALHTARLTPPEIGQESDEVRALISFVRPSDGMPDWARARATTATI